MTPEEKIQAYENEIARLKLLLEQKSEKLDELIHANNNFRLLMLSIDSPNVPVADAIYLGNLRSKWQNAPIEEIMRFLELFDSHAAIFSMITQDRLGKDAGKKRAQEKDAALAEETRRIREKQAREKEEKLEAALMCKPQTPEEKAIAKMAASMKISYDAAKLMFDSMRLK